MRRIKNAAHYTHRRIWYREGVIQPAVFFAIPIGGNLLMILLVVIGRSHNSIHITAKGFLWGDTLLGQKVGKLDHQEFCSIVLGVGIKVVVGAILLNILQPCIGHLKLQVIHLIGGCPCGKIVRLGGRTLLGTAGQQHTEGKQARNHSSHFHTNPPFQTHRQSL